ncbi:glycerate kinase [Mycolicibacterium sp. CH28]|uniref:glycerate kinase family protein n=1 Tax=Mycolicibacterium sp. CH28 TaxID=2512237 RepID=UPI00107FDDBB|nr:glycerate kinase [Mycolicibacterium sp. CH28]TGD85025.1 glycerate kinase [Mycolicibacterium sp. CH28]
MRVLIAPDCYGDSLTAVEAAQSIATGWRQARPADEITLAPQSDGGPGFVGVLASRFGGLRQTRVSGPLTGAVDAEWVYDPRTATAYIECAQACGLALLGGQPTPDTAVAAHSRGVGQLVGAALDAGADTIVVGLGGSSCTDGGRGLIEALGGLAQARDKLAGIHLIAATDVEHPLLGPMGAARIFGPQKGADPATVEILEQRMTAWAARLDALAGDTVSPLPGAGAAGGLGAALLALGARRESGAAVIAEHTGLADDIAAADMIVTGEGRFDDQSLHGKVVSALAGGAAPRGIPVVVLAGQVTLEPAALAEAGIVAAYAIADHAGSVQLAIDDAANQLAGLARVTAADLRWLTRE